MYWQTEAVSPSINTNYTIDIPMWSIGSILLGAVGAFAGMTANLIHPLQFAHTVAVGAALGAGVSAFVGTYTVLDGKAKPLAIVSAGIAGGAAGGAAGVATSLAVSSTYGTLVSAAVGTGVGMMVGCVVSAVISISLASLYNASQNGFFSRRQQSDHPSHPAHLQYQYRPL